jgi:hypothetical protein
MRLVDFIKANSVVSNACLVSLAIFGTLSVQFMLDYFNNGHKPEVALINQNSKQNRNILLEPSISNNNQAILQLKEDVSLLSKKVQDILDAIESQNQTELADSNDRPADWVSPSEINELIRNPNAIAAYKQLQQESSREYDAQMDSFFDVALVDENQSIQDQIYLEDQIMNNSGIQGVEFKELQCKTGVCKIDLVFDLNEEEYASGIQSANIAFAISEKYPTSSIKERVVGDKVHYSGYISDRSKPLPKRNSIFSDGKIDQHELDLIRSKM